MRVSHRWLILSLPLLGALACTGEPSADLLAPSATLPTLPRLTPNGTSSRSAAPPLVTASKTIDWSGYPVGVQPGGWSQIWDPSPYFLTASEPTVGSGEVLQWSATGQTRNRWGLAYDGFGEVTDQEVYTELRMTVAPVTDVSYMGAAAVRMGGTSSDEHGYAVFFVNNPSWNYRNIVLATWINGGYYYEFANYALTWQENAWYSVRLQAMGQQIRARIWSRGAKEPTTWQLSAWDSTYASGRPGVSNHDNGTVQWATWTGSVLADTSSATAPAGVEYQSGFSEFAAGVQPAGWTATSGPANVTWRIISDATASDGVVLRSMPTITARHILRFDAIPDTTTTQEVLVKERLGDDDSRGPGIALRHTMNSSGYESAYVAYLRSGTDQVEVNAFVNGGWQFVGNAQFVNDPGVWYWIRFRAEGAGLRVKVWPDGSSEPSSWTFTGSNSALPAGSVGLYSYEPNTVDYDVFSVATGGLSAPALGFGSPPPSPQALAQITVTPSQASVQLGGALQFRAIGALSDGTTSSPTVNWSATGGTITSAGAFTAGSVAGTYQVTATEPTSGITGSTMVIVTAPPLPPPLPAPAGALVWQTGFASYTTGSTPGDWTPTSQPANVTWSVVVDATTSDQAVLRNITTATQRHILRYSGVTDSTTTQEVLVKMRLAQDNDRGPGIALRHTMSPTGSETAYVAYLRSSSDQLEINAFVNSGWQFVGAVNFVNRPGVWYWMRFRAEGTTLNVRVWADGTPEPTAWTYTGSNSSITAGGVGVYSYEPNTVDYDYFSVATTGATAP